MLSRRFRSAWPRAWPRHLSRAFRAAGGVGVGPGLVQMAATPATPATPATKRRRASKGGSWAAKVDRDPTFVADLKESDRVVDLLRADLEAQGFPVRKPELRIRSESDARSGRIRQWADDGDLFVGDHRIEVKQRVRMEFGEDGKDYPYPTVFVDVCHAFDRADPKPFAYVFFDAKCENRFVLFPGDGDFVRVTKWDRFRKRERNFYEAPRDRIRAFPEFLAKLRESDSTA